MRTATRPASNAAKTAGEKYPADWPATRADHEGQPGRSKLPFTTHHQIAAAREEERQRIARELHDGTGQLLSALSVGLKTLEDAIPSRAKAQVGQLRRLAARIHEELGSLTRGLHPIMVQELGLAGALDRLVSEFFQNNPVRVELVIGRLNCRNLPIATQVAVYRIIQESLANVAKHARATRVRIALKLHASTLHVIVRDNGRGFRFGNARFQSQAHMGFHTMRERAESLGGELWVDSSLGRGACVWAVIPLAHT